MAALTTQRIVGSGLGPTYTGAAAGGDTIEPGPRNFLHVKNGGAGAVTVTIDAVRQCDQGFDHDLVVSVPAGADRMIGPVDASRFARASDGRAAVTYSGVTSVTVAALTL